MHSSTRNDSFSLKAVTPAKKKPEKREAAPPEVQDPDLIGLQKLPEVFYIIDALVMDADGTSNQSK